MDGHEAIQRYYGDGDYQVVSEICARVNRQAIAPFLRPHLSRAGSILDAGGGSGNLAALLNIPRSTQVDLTWERLRRPSGPKASGYRVQADVADLPFADSSFDTVVCSNVLHYCGTAGLEELVRVTRPGGGLLLAFLEDSDWTREFVASAVFWGMFPPLMRRLCLLPLSDLKSMKLIEEDSATVVFVPPVYQAWRHAPRRGLVIYALRKPLSGAAPHRARKRKELA